ncbi:MAG: hypothetical protein HQK50_13650 [Oligoflexia bacterium]|nr:hypothetical protein [Oligoflexia bacterium]
MDKEHLLANLSRNKKDMLLEIIGTCFDECTIKQRNKIFGQFYNSILSWDEINENKLRSKIDKFKRDSFDGVYYAPFEINSKNFTHVPDETEKWFDNLGDLLLETKELANQNKPSEAIHCFQKLFQLIDDMAGGHEFIFADEYGTWMIPVRMSDITDCYISSAASVCNPKEFTEHLLPLFRRDSRESFSNHVMKHAKKYANNEQLKFLLEELKNQKIRVQQEINARWN